MKYNIKEKLRGWRGVYSFTTVQALKSKSNRVTMIIFTLLILCSMPVVTIFKGNLSNLDNSHIQTVYYLDESGYNLLDQLPNVFSTENYDNINFVSVDKTEYDEFERSMESDEYTDNNVLIRFYQDSELGSFVIRELYPVSSDLNDISASVFAEEIQSSISMLVYNSAGFDEKTINYINEPVEVIITTADTDGSFDANDVEESYGLSTAEYGISYAGIFIVMIFIAFSGELIATSIVTEKSNRVTEYLMTSVRPLAIIFGKVLSGLTVVLIQFSVMLAAFGCSILIENTLSGTKGLPSFISDIFTPEIIKSFNILNLLLCLVMLILGFILFGTIAGLAGATVSRVEDTAEGLKLYTMVMIIGAYIGLANVIFSLFEAGSPLEWISLLLPISSPFILPVYLLIGRTTVTVALISIAILIISICLLCLFVARVYENMIFYNGSVIKLKDMIKMYTKKEIRHE